MAVLSTERLNFSRVLAGIRARVVLVYLFALLPAIAMAALQPVWSRVDETQHADILAQYEHGVVPVEGTTMLQPAIVAVDEMTGVFRWYPPGAGPPPGELNPDAFVPPQQGATANAKKAWMERHLWGYSYEAMQPPLYYLLAEPDWLIGDQFGGTIGAIYAARLFSALIAACLAPLVYLLALTIRPGAERMALIAAGLAALLPGYVLNATQITNDGLAAVLGAGLTLIAIKGARDGWTRKLAVACGVVLGAAAMTKLTAVGLVPLVAAAFLWPGVQPLRARLVSGAIAGAIALAAVTPWLLFNFHMYHQPVPSHATRAVLGAAFPPPSHTLSYLRGSARNALDEFVAGEPFAINPFTRVLIWLTEAFALVVAAGLFISRKRLRLEWLLLLGGAADVVWVLGTPYLSGIGGLMPGRYLYPIAAAGLVIVAVGIDALPSLISRLVAAGGAAGALLAIVLLVGSHFGQTPQLRAVPRPTTGTSVQVRGDVAGLDVFADRVLVANSGHSIWVHVTVTDRSQNPADFPPMPAATANGTWLNGDYSDSTAFPERLQPGESASGWLLFTRAGKSHVTQIVLMYTPISTDGYATIQTLTLVVAP